MVFTEDAGNVASLLADQEYVRLVARAHDADALAAASLLALALQREGVDFHFSTIPDLDEARLSRLADERCETLVLVDFPDVPEKDASTLAGNLVLVHDADHVSAPEEALTLTAVRANAKTGLEASASVLAFEVALQFSQRNRDLAVLALAGAVAEGQHGGGGFRGLNAEYATDAVEQGALKLEPGLELDGGTLLDAVAQGVDPFFAGLAGRARVAKRVLTDSELPAERAPGDLDEEETTRVASALALRLLQSRAPDGAVDTLALPRWVAADGAFAGESVAGLARRLRAAAARGAAGHQVAWLWQREGAAADALADAEHAFRESALATLVRTERESRDQETGPVVVDAPDAASARVLADAAALAVTPAHRVTVAVAEADGTARVAVTAGRGAVNRGFDAGHTLRDAATAAGGRAFGNPARAYATVPADRVKGVVDAVKEATPA